MIHDKLSKSAIHAAFGGLAVTPLSNSLPADSRRFVYTKIFPKVASHTRSPCRPV